MKVGGLISDLVVVDRSGPLESYEDCERACWFRPIHLGFLDDRRVRNLG